MNLRLITTSVALLCCLCLSLLSSAQVTTASPSPQITPTQLSFDQPEFNYGTILQGEIVKNVFVLHNDGEEPLIISNAKGSCGCTVPEWPKEPIMPGESAQILVQFDSKGKSGKQNKRVTITANTEPAQTFLTIRGEVITEETATKSDSPSIEALPPAVIINRAIDVNSIMMYPNPTSHEFRVDLNNFIGQKANIKIFNQMGQLMQARNVDEINGDERFDVSEYAPGIYSVTVKVEGMVRVAKHLSIGQ